jgi:hypothetical protein
MRRPLWFRTLASMLALWFPLVAGEPGVLHPCPTHGSGSALATSLHGAHAGASMHSAAHGAGHHSAPSAPGHDHHNCTCISCCTASAAALRAPDAPTIEIMTVERAASAAVPNAASLPRPAPEYARPYTTGPPRV